MGKPNSAQQRYVKIKKNILCQCGIFTLMGFVRSVDRLIHEIVLADLLESTLGGAFMFL